MSFWSSLRKKFRSPPVTETEKLDEVQRLIGYHFTDRSLLELSLTHRSFVRAGNGRSPSNERLEFLGDSVLGLVIADQLFQDNPRKREGNLTKMKAMLVNELTLSQIAGEIGLNQYIRMSPEEERSGGRERPSILSDAFESVIGAVYLDSGLEGARNLVLRLIYARREAILSDSSQRNYKGDLLELVQAAGQGMPRYDVVAEKGPDHEKTFHVTVSVAGETVGHGYGLSKKEAEQRAASEALEYYDNNESGSE
jgi:ribonuclease-3